jgi:hypothetical protein
LLPAPLARFSSKSDQGTFAVTGDFSRMSAIYISFVTLATLGYGDIVPRTDVARGFAIVERVGVNFFWRLWLPVS